MSNENPDSLGIADSLSVSDILPLINRREPWAWERRKKSISDMGPLGKLLLTGISPDNRVITRVDAFLVQAGLLPMPGDPSLWESFQLARSTINTIIQEERPDIVRQVQAANGGRVPDDFDWCKALDVVERIGEADADDLPQTAVELVVKRVADWLKKQGAAFYQEKQSDFPGNLTTRSAEVTTALPAPQPSAWLNERTVIEKLGPMGELLLLGLTQPARESGLGITRVDALLFANGLIPHPATPAATQAFAACREAIAGTIKAQRPAVVDKIKTAYGLSADEPLPADFDLLSAFDIVEGVGDDTLTVPQTPLAPLVRETILNVTAPHELFTRLPLTEEQTRRLRSLVAERILAFSPPFGDGVTLTALYELIGFINNRSRPPAKFFVPRLSTVYRRLVNEEILVKPDSTDQLTFDLHLKNLARQLTSYRELDYAKMPANQLWALCTYLTCLDEARTNDDNVKTANVLE
ncbi:hypothetical protein HY214_03165 [Candidatus Roizmanbacteria bacterium]|nr:hypothetical protein [Candidatus Roizmanbacteria bacterium]